MYNRELSKYDQFGVLKTQPWQNIQKGDLVEYTDTKSVYNEKGIRKSTKIYLKGIWDGEKVCFDDKEKTTVRTTRWLKKRSYTQKFYYKINRFIKYLFGKSR